MYYKIPIRFQREVILHILKNTQPNLLIDGTPCILSIYGPPGEGKTEMCKQILNDLGAKTVVMSISEFESENAGEPAEILRRKYEEAEQYLLSSPNNISVLLIDDIDTAIGNWGEGVQYTVNTQIIVGELMQIANSEKRRKVPIILTGNDFTKIYNPLKRSGRMTSYYWEPDSDERLDSVQMIYSWLSVSECITLIDNCEQYAADNELPRPPISFYSTIQGKLCDDELWGLFYKARQSCDNLSYISNIVLPEQNLYSLEHIITICCNELIRIKTSHESFIGGNTDGIYSN